MAQRVVIAMALISDPKIIIADEATSARGIPLLLLSHDLWAVRKFCDDIAVMYAGRVVEQGPAESFYGLAGHPYSHGLQFASGLTDDEALELRLGQIDLNAEGCPLAERCPLVQETCRASMPPMDIRDRRRFACHVN